MNTFVEVYRLVHSMHPQPSFRSLLRRGKLMTTAIAHWRDFNRWYASSGNELLAASMRRAPMISGALYWPYIHKDWPRARRLEVISKHYRLLEGTAGILARAACRDVELFSFGEQYPGLRIVLDKAQWFVREGEVVLNLFQDDTRLYSIAFTLGIEANKQVVYLGAIQGSHLEDALSIYRDLTHRMHGLRPRDLSMAVLKFVCGAIGIRNIWAISGCARQHNSKYFAEAKKKELLTDFDEIWLEHNGVDLGNGFFEIPAEVRYRELTEIPSKKRAAYRRRYQLLEELGKRITEACVAVPDGGGTSEAAAEDPYKVILAYLAPEVPALSATFVYEEILGLERRGVSIIPVSVHRPRHPAFGQEDLARRVHYLYVRSRSIQVLTGFARLLSFRGAPKAVGMLISDILECGTLKPGTWKLVYQFLVAVKLAGILRKERCMRLHVHFAHVPTQIAMYACAMAGVPFTIMAHANDIFERGLLLQRKAERAERMLTISLHNRDYLKRIGVVSEKLALVRCGVSFVEWTGPGAFTLRDRYRIGTLGRIVEKKGMDVLIRAVAELRQRPYRIELSIAGDGPLRDELERLTAELKMSEIVRFEGSVPHQQVQSWMRGLDAFVLSCKCDANGDMDGIPVVLMEAMSQSVPVISSRLSGIPELVMDGVTGLLAAPGDHFGVAAKIDQLLSSPELRQAMAERAREHVRNEFGQQVNLDRLAVHLGIATRQ